MAYQSITTLSKVLLGGLEAREREVLKKRYGLGGGEGVTLAAIGAAYKLTRERIRQIEAAGLAAARKAVTDASVIAFADAASKRLRESGNALREDVFFADLEKLTGDRMAERDFGNHARFVLEVAGKAMHHAETEALYPFWHLKSEDAERVKKFSSKLASVLKQKKGEVLENQGMFAILATQSAKAVGLPEGSAREWAQISKEFSVNTYGDYGLAQWAEVDPKTARDWAYLVLKKEKRPVHFTELSDIVRKFRSGKRTNMQSIHNELIKDERFVLVGRGMYGLREQGYLPGTAREVLAHFLKKYGPPEANKIVKLVLAERIFKPSTLVINLQNKRHFALLPDGRYTVREA